jgi:hypothetical protein
MPQLPEQNVSSLQVFVVVAIDRREVVMTKPRGPLADPQYYLPGGEVSAKRPASVTREDAAEILQADTGISLPAYQFRRVGKFYETDADQKVHCILVYRVNADRGAVVSQMRPQGRSRDVAIVRLDADSHAQFEPHHFWLVIEGLLET